MKNKNRAFSLIELSIVILIIGILIAGVTQGSRLVGASKLQTAQNVTQSSPVQSTKGLVLWLEPTKEKSFLSSEAVDKGELSRWFDNNPQLAIPASFQATASANITYTAISAINGLPSVTFSAANTALVGPYNGATLSSINTPFNAYTIFAVVRSTSLAAANTIFYNGTSGTNGFALNKTATDGAFSVAAQGLTALTSATNTAVGVPEILSVTIEPDSVLGVAEATPAVASFKNGVAGIASDFSGNLVASTVGMYVGNAAAAASTQFVGDISELIVFDSALNNTSRQQIEKYLSKKYAIPVTQ